MEEKTYSENVIAEKVLTVTSIEDLKKACSGEIVPLPPFSEGTEFCARLKRPSILAMAKAGRIPNELLVSANELFSQGAARTAISKTNDSKMLSEMFAIIDCYCEDAFVEPTYQQLKDNGIELTDQQMLFIFQYAQSGVKDLKSFR